MINIAQEFEPFVVQYQILSTAKLMHTKNFVTIKKLLVKHPLLLLNIINNFLPKLEIYRVKLTMHSIITSCRGSSRNAVRPFFSYADHTLLAIAAVTRAFLSPYPLYASSAPSWFNSLPKQSMKT
jgi:hypothetical protein